MKVEITKAQLQAIADMANNLEASIGGSEPFHTDVDFDKEAKKQLNLIDRFFSNNGYKR
jgi:hypothetical protein